MLNLFINDYRDVIELKPNEVFNGNNVSTRSISYESINLINRLIDRTSLLKPDDVILENNTLIVFKDGINVAEYLISIGLSKVIFPSVNYGVYEKEYRLITEKSIKFFVYYLVDSVIGNRLVDSKNIISMLGNILSSRMCADLEGFSQCGGFIFTETPVVFDKNMDTLGLIEQVKWLVLSLRKRV